jgi:hypothetical protein
MTRGRGRTPYRAKAARKQRMHLKDRRRAASVGRAEQGMGRAGKPGGTKSAGGCGGRVQGGMRGRDRGGGRIGARGGRIS